MATDDGLRYIDSDGHILEHPTGDARLRARRSTATASGTSRPTTTARSGSSTTATACPANGMAAAGTAGLSDEDRARAFRGEMRYTEARPAAWNAKARLQDMDQDGIDLAVLYPTMLLGLQSETDVDFAEAQARAYNDWCSDHVQEGEGRLFGAGAVPPMHEPDDVARVAAEIRRVAELPGHGVGVHAPEPGGRLAAVQRPGLRPDLAGGRRHRPADRAAPVPRRPTCPARAWVCVWRGPVTPTAATSTTSTRTPSTRSRSSSRIPS